MPALTSDPRRVIYRRPELLTDRSTHFCPGCGHGIIHRLVAELLDEMHLGPTTVGVAAVGCSVFAYDYLAVDFVESPHGRAPAVATGVRRGNAFSALKQTSWGDLNYATRDEVDSLVRGGGTRIVR